MPTPEELEALARRCETEKASRDLDLAIDIAVNGQQFGARAHGGLVEPPYTTSLDAAVTLEPKDAQEICVRKYRNGGHYVRITLADGQPVYSEVMGRPIAEAAARTAAALRARAALASPPKVRE